MTSRTCPNCGALVASATARFCADCGSSISAGGAHSDRPVDTTDATLDLAGERKFVTILFADVKGSTEVASGLDPEDWFDALERFAIAANAAIHEFDGVVTSYGGDGVMAVFGAPIAHESHAAQACRAALSLLERMRTIARDLEPIIGATLGLRIGLNSGEVVVGRIGDEHRTTYTAQGLPVHIAARMEQIAVVGEVNIAPATATLVGDQFALAVVGERMVKGIAEPILVHRLLGGPGVATGNVRDPGSPRATYVGRATELDALRTARSQASAGRPCVVAITAPAGHGKSRLLSECIQHSQASGSDVVTVAGDVARVPAPMWTATELARAVLAVDAEAGVEAIEAALIAVGLATGAWSAPLVGLLTHVGVGDRVDPDLARRQVAASLRRVLAARARRSQEALVVAIDDVHAIDRASQLTLASLLDPLPDARVLVILTNRPTHVVDDLLPDGAHRMDLEVLDETETEQLVRQWLLHPEEARDVALLLHERTGGNPFFVLETLRSLVESQHLVGPRGACRLAGPLRDIRVPGRVQTVIASRIDRLGRDERDVLHAAAVIGVEFDLETLVAVAAMGAGGTAVLLDRLVAADLVRTTGAAGYAFRHRITQEVAYETQLRSQRRRGHALVASALEARPGSETRASLIADHHERADAPATAAEWYRRGAETAARTDPPESLRQWQKVRALTVPTDAPSVSAALLCRAEILTQGARAGLEAGEVLTVIEEARVLADDDDDQRPLLAFVLLRGWYGLSGVGLTPQARAISKEAVALADASTIAMLSVGARLALVSNYAAAGPVADGLAVCDEIEALLSEGDLGSPRGLPRCQVDFARGSLLLRTGRIDESVALIETAVAGADDCDDPQWRVISRVGLVVALVAAEEALEAERVADESVAIARDVCGTGELGQAVRAVGLAALAAGRAGDAIAALEEALAIARETPNLTTEEMVVAALAEAHLLRGDIGRACGLAREAIAIARERANDTYELMGQLALARCLVADPAHDRDAIERAIERCRSLVAVNGVELYRPAVDELSAAVT